MRLFTSFAAGLVFAVGLVLGGMTQPGKVIGFLDVSGGAWDPSLALVMGGALAVYGIAFRLITKRTAPVLTPRFLVPTRRDLTPRLFAGAALFGTGWAIAGFCPGPALVSVAAGMTEALIFLPGMVAGMLLFGVWDQRAARRPASSVIRSRPPAARARPPSRS